MDYKTLSVKTFIEDMNGKEIMICLLYTSPSPRDA